MRNELSDLAAFAVIAQERSFTTAARRLGVSQSALSHSMRGLEKRLGVELLARTSRSVSPTTAGGRLLKDLAPALEQIEHSLKDVRKQTVRPAGRVRLVVPRVALTTFLLPKLAKFATEYPDIVLDITTSSNKVDIVADGFDAGIQIGESVQRDMIAVRVSDDLRLAVFASPAYFQTRPIPKTPRDLKAHTCLAFRFKTGVYRWEFEKGRQSVTVNPQGPLIIDDSELVQVLQDWRPSFPGFYLYYPSRRNRPASLSELIRAIRLAG